MRFPVLLIAGVVFIALGVGLREYARRHPWERPAPVVAPPAAALTPEELIGSVPPENLGADSELEAISARLAEQSKSAALPEEVTVPNAAAVLEGSLFIRNAIAHGNALYFVLEEGKQGAKQTLVRISAGQSPRALAVHRPGVSAIAVAGEQLFWAEGGEIFSTSAATGGAAKGLARFPRSRVTSLGVREGAIVATLVPAGLDPFSSDPVGAVVWVSDGKVVLLASKQIRPAEAGTDGTTAVWTAGYPSDLLAADLRTQHSRTVATRADGPVLIDQASIVFRHPAVGAPELQSIGTAPGTEVRSLAKGEVDRVARFGDDVWFSIGGVVRQLALADGAPREVARLTRPVLELAVTDDALYTVTRQDNGNHLLLRLPRSVPEGSR